MDPFQRFGFLLHDPVPSAIIDASKAVSQCLEIEIQEDSPRQQIDRWNRCEMAHTVMIARQGYKLST